MKPWRAALTSATASGKSTRIASRIAIACSSAVPLRRRSARAPPRSARPRCSASASRTARAAPPAPTRPAARRTRAARAGDPRGRRRTGIRIHLPCAHVSARSVERNRARPRARTRRRRPVPARSALANGDASSPSARSSASVGDADLVEVGGRGDARRRADRPLERERGRLGLLDPRRLLDHPHLGELRAQLLEVAAAGEIVGELAHRDDRRGVAHVVAPRRPAAPSSSRTSQRRASSSPSATR